MDCKEIKLVNAEGISLEYSLEGLMLKLKVQYFGLLMRRATSLEKTLMLEKTEGRGRRTKNKMVGWHHRLNGHSLSKLQEVLKDWEAWCAAVHGIAKHQTRLRG